MGKVYPGSHFVTAHGSPDLDTTVASFWGWVDAFSARVSEGSTCGMFPAARLSPRSRSAFSSIRFLEMGCFDHLAKTRTTLALSGIDLMTQKGLVRKQTDGIDPSKIDRERSQNAVVLVDEEGYYLGDWRSFDVEGVRQVIMLLNNCLRWFENHLHVKLISLFAKEELSLKDMPSFLKAVFSTKLGDCAPAKEFSEKQRKHVEDYLSRCWVLGRGSMHFRGVCEGDEGAFFI